MKVKYLVFALAGALLAPGCFADAKDEVKAAARKLSELGSYSWRSTVTVPDSARFRPGPTEGKTEQGTTHVKMTFGDNTTEAYIQAEKAAVLTQDGEWQSAAELENAEGARRFMGAFARNFRTPTAQAMEIVEHAKEIKKEGDAYAGELNEEGAKQLIRFRRGGSDGPEITGAKGSVKFWVKDGMLSRMESKVTGKTSFNGNDIEIDRTTTTEIKEAGSTKVSVPEAAKKKLG